MTTNPPRLRLVTQAGNIANLLRETLPDNVQLIETPSLADADVAPLLEDADIFVSNRFTAGMAERASGLRLVQTTGIGADGIDPAALPPGTTVCNVDGHDVGVTEYAFMVALALQNDLIGMDRRLRDGDWGDRGGAPRPELRNRTLAIIGLGRIGSQIARVASIFQMQTLAVTRRPDAERAGELGLAFLGSLDDLHQVLPRADFVMIAVPLTDETRGLIGEPEFGLMKPTAYLVNVARGHVVDEAALYQALRDRTIAGAAIDVWYRYPAARERAMPSDYPLHELDNVIMTPHVAGWSEGTIRVRMSQIGENARRLAAGEALINVVYPPRLAEDDKR